MLNLIVLIFAASVWSSVKLDLNDVTILIDLPRPEENLSFLLGPTNSGSRGELLPAEYYTGQLPLVRGATGMDYPADETKALRVIGARVDPCFKFTGSATCFPQLRLIWQPVELMKDGEYSTYDAAIHTFYNLTQVEFEQLIVQIRDLKASSGVSTAQLPLQTHPAYKKTTARTAFNQELRKIILKFAGKSNLRRLTFMKQLTANLWWGFSGLEIKNDAATSMTLLRQSNATYNDQQFFNEKMFEGLKMRGTILPNIKKEIVDDNLTELLKGYAYNFRLPIVKKGLETLDRIENPSIFTPENIDCVHCHVTNSARAWLSDEDKEYYRKNNVTRYRYQGQNLKNTSQTNNTKSMRIFGYFGKKTSISQRVINETAEVVKTLNR